jgi:hypothetical protein
MARAPQAAVWEPSSEGPTIRPLPQINTTAFSAGKPLCPPREIRSASDVRDRTGIETDFRFAICAGTALPSRGNRRTRT